MAEAEFVQGMTPFLRESLGVYGDEVLTSAAVAGAGAGAEVGRELLRTTHRRVDERGREGLVEAVREAAAEPGNEDAVGVLRQEIRRALRKHPELEGELAALLPGGGGGSTTVIASGARSIAAGGNIGVAITGDGHGSSKR
ncbi:MULTISPECIES: hypothetical protein [unclassified Streptomyces]|uniref:hypothetical protein n=1 Tax=unclassified Streptomyces TaxID=2593676 RepID=UPI002257F039|nr:MULTISPECIES: hypothetical protein [unclassified Streptomyces]MCX5333398.1 hypothetical protein [Streptomyces sp. NBC_00140]MCX5362816.1 hypothetical protein [Streptomyces sp. NBC_00124]